LLISVLMSMLARFSKPLMKLRRMRLTMMSMWSEFPVRRPDIRRLRPSLSRCLKRVMLATFWWFAVVLSRNRIMTF